MKIVDAKEERDVMDSDVPNYFTQVDMTKAKLYKERVIMKITGVLVDLMVIISQNLYGTYVVY